MPNAFDHVYADDNKTGSNAFDKVYGAPPPAAAAPTQAPGIPAGPPAPEQESGLKSTLMEIPRLGSEIVSGMANIPVKAYKGYKGIAAMGQAALQGKGLDESLQAGTAAIGDRNAVKSPLAPSKTGEFIGKKVIQPGIKSVSETTGLPEELVSGGVEAAGDIAGLYGLKAGIPPVARLAGKVAGKTASGLGDTGAGLLGTYTGTGKRFIKEAAAPGDTETFTKYMRGGEEGGKEIVSKAKDAVQKIKDQRGEEYRAKLAQLAENQAPITDAPAILQDRLNTQLSKFGVKMTKNPAGEDVPDFSRSTIDRKSQGDVTHIIDTIQGWGKKPGDLTPLSLDTLKRQLDDFYSDSKNSRAMVASLRDGVKKLIVDKVPEYADMTKGYAEATGLINELERTLSLGKKPMIDTTMRKLTSSMRDNFSFRTELLHQLQEATGENLESAIAGYNLSSMAPQGGFGKLTSGSLSVGVLAHALSPHYLALLAMSSPRIVGESLRALGIGARYVNRILHKLPDIKKYVGEGKAAGGEAGQAGTAGVAGEAVPPKPGVEPAPVPPQTAETAAPLSSTAPAPEPVVEPSMPDYKDILDSLTKQTGIVRGKGKKNWTDSDFRNWLKQSYPTVAARYAKSDIFKALEGQIRGEKLGKHQQRVIDAFNEDHTTMTANETYKTSQKADRYAAEAGMDTTGWTDEDKSNFVEQYEDFKRGQGKQSQPVKDDPFPHYKHKID